MVKGLNLLSGFMFRVFVVGLYGILGIGLCGVVFFDVLGFPSFFCVFVNVLISGNCFCWVFVVYILYIYIYMYITPKDRLMC